MKYSTKILLTLVFVLALTFTLNLVSATFTVNYPVYYGTSYFSITNTDQDFFYGRRNRANIPCNFKINTLSISNSPQNTYSTNIIYTVSEY